MRRLAAPAIAAACLAAACLLAACSGDNGGVIGGSPQARQAVAPAGQLHNLLPPKIATAATLRVFGQFGRAPLLFYGTGTRQPEGFEWDLLQDIGRQLGVSVTVTDAPQVALPQDLAAGRADTIASSFVDLRAFEHTGIDFVDYLTGRSGVLVRQGNPRHVQGAADLCGRTVGIGLGTAQQVVVGALDAGCRAAHRQGLQPVLAPDHGALVGLLTGGKVDAVLDDAVVASYTANVSTGAATLEVVGEPVAPMPYGIGIAHSDPHLVDAVRAALQAVISDGEYDSALARWGVEISGLRTATVNAGA